MELKKKPTIEKKQSVIRLAIVYLKLYTTNVVQANKIRRLERYGKVDYKQHIIVYNYDERYIFSL